MKTLKLLIEDIHKELPSLLKIEKGQIFNSQYYGNIVATIITKHSEAVYSIYGFDEKEGLPRDCYYPRDLKLVGKSPCLNDILAYLAKKGLKIELEHDGNIIWINTTILWDVRIPLLQKQAESTIEKIFALAFPEQEK